jgi:NADPH:quinone reductase-like Zn-dependent oxidoreductase
MKAAQYSAYGDVSVVSVNPDAPKPVPKPGQVLVAVRAVSFNPFDASLRSGMMKERMPFPMPITVGGDFSGTNTETGEELFGSANVANGGTGSFAQYVAANAINTAPKPKQSTFEEAAALPLVGSSAVQALEEYMKLQKGQTILIHGGAGGIGHIAIQLAKYIGAYVATTVRTKDMEFVRVLGADAVIDFTKEDFSVKLKDFDAVYDTVGGDVLIKSQAVLKPGGIIVSMKGQPMIGIGQATKTNTGNLKRVAELVALGAIHVHIDKTFSIDQVTDAWKYQEEGRPQGKVVVLL